MPLFGSSFHALHDRSGLDIVFGGIARPRANHFAISHTLGGRTDRLNGLVIRTGHGLGGLVMASARAATVRDYLSDGHITHAYDAAVAAERMRTVSAFPVIVKGDVRGVIYGATRDAAMLTPEASAAMKRVADGFGYDLAVEEALAQRAEVADAAARMRSGEHPAPDREWEDVRVAFAELRELAQDVEDAGIRARLDAILQRMTHPRSAEVAPLSAREVDVLALVAMGCGNAEIGTRLNLGAETVKSYLRTASRKLGAANRVEAVRLARAAGQLP